MQGPQFIEVKNRHLKGEMPDHTAYDCWCDFEAMQALLMQEVDNKPVKWEILPLTPDGVGFVGPENIQRFEHTHWTIVDQPQRYKQEILHSPGSIAGIPGTHGTGVYIIDWQERAIVTLAEWEETQAIWLCNIHDDNGVYIGREVNVDESGAHRDGPRYNLKPGAFADLCTDGILAPMELEPHWFEGHVPMKYIVVPLETSTQLS